VAAEKERTVPIARRRIVEVVLLGVDSHHPFAIGVNVASSRMRIQQSSG
jgi:hypothetical protein